MPSNTVLAKMAVLISAQNAEFNRALADSEGKLAGFQKSVMDIAKTLGVGFGVQQVASFSLELIKLAGVADGVKQAFNKIANSAQVLESMKQATRGTVSELELMKSAVQASNFDIPIEQLGTLFQFAYERAKATGQSVDYLVNSIVTGIGRKSPLILDNLGISAVQLKEKLGGISTEAATIGQVAEAVGAIAKQSLEQMGESAVTAAEKIAKIETNWENFKERAGTGLAAFFDPLLEGLNTLTGGANKSLGELESLVAEFGRTGVLFENLSTIQRKADEAGVGLLKWAESAEKAQEEGSVYKETLKELIETLKLLTPEKTPAPTPLAPQLGIIQMINEEIKKLTEEKNKAFDTTQIVAYNKQLASLKQLLEDINKAGISNKERKRDPRIDLSVGPVNRATIESNITPWGQQGLPPLMSLEDIAKIERAQLAAEKLAKTLKTSLAGAISNVAVAIGRMAVGMDTNFEAVILQSIGQVAVNLGELLVATGVGIESFKKSLLSLEGIPAIVAGGALIAAGSAFMALAGSVGSGGGGRGGSPVDRAADSKVLRPLVIRIEGGFDLQGNTLRAFIKKAEYVNGRTGG